MKHYIIIVTFLLLVTLFGCNTFKKSDTNKILVSVGSEDLTMSKLKLAIPLGIKGQDSTVFADNFIEKWIRDQLMLEKAELNLDDKTQKEIDALVDNYRTSLMVFKYQQMLVSQKLDTVVTSEHIDEYYNIHSGNFILERPVVKALYIKVAKSTPDRYKIRRLIQSKNKDDLITFEEYCYQNTKESDMGVQWQYFSNVLAKLPNTVKDSENFLKREHYIESTDSLYAYYLNIVDYKLTLDTTPQNFVSSKIKDIIINHRKVDLIRNLENNIYNDAANHKKFTIHNN